jgi:ligand-binding sensor domain-containing protein/signal transduction histidine kinase
MKRCRAWLVWLAFAFQVWVGGAGGARAQNSAIAGSTSHIWGASEGLPEQIVQAFAQTRDGMLWIGTSGGLVRFDGTHFTVYDRQNTPAIHENSVFCLMVARDGALWIGTEGGGLARYSDGQFHSWTTQDGLSNDFVRTLAEDASGTLWVGTDNGLLRFAQGHFARVDGTDRIPALAVHAIARDWAGALWVGGSKLLRLHGGEVKEYTLGGEASENRVKSILQTQDGSIWVGTVAGVQRLPSGAKSFVRVGGIHATVRILRQAADGTLWIGTIGQGAYQYHAGTLMHIAAPAALPSNTVLNFFEDSERNFWIGTQTGMMRLATTQVRIVPLPKANDADFETISEDRDGSFWIGSTQLLQMRNGLLTPRTFPGLAGVHVRNVFRDRAGALWVGSDGDGVFRIKGNRTLHLTVREGLTNNFVRAMAEDRDGSLWVAADEGLNHIFLSAPRPRIVRYEMRDGLAYFSTRVLLVDRVGDVWIGTDRGVSHIHDGHFLKDVATAALAQMKIWSIHEDFDGSLWFGTRNNGLFRVRNGRLTHFTVADGLASNAIYQILEDKVGHLWLSGPNGVSLLDRHELDAQAESFPRHLTLVFYSAASMAPNIEIYGDTQSSGCITAAGEVWFPSNLGPIHILPKVRAPLPPPQIFIQSVLADGRPLALNGSLVLRPGNSRLEFAFTPIRLSSQDGLRFRYRLEGFEKKWNASSTARTGDYTNLPAGRYRFLVQVFDVSNPTAVGETSIMIVQRQFFYRTWWFSTALLALAVLLVVGLYRFRVRQVHARFDAVIEERSRLAREMHDTVIQGCTGVSALLEAVSMGGANQNGLNGGLLDVARTQLRNTLAEAREAIWNLRQTEDAESLGIKLESMAGQLGGEFHVPVSWSMQGMQFALDGPEAHDLLMVAREAVLNAMFHGHPTQVAITLSYFQRELVLRIVDDGRGFGPRAVETGKGHHFGLKGMRERVARLGGKFRLVSVPDQGTEIEVHVPRRQ